MDVGSDTLPAGGGSVLVGLALSSHDNTALASERFDSVFVTEE